MSIFELFDLCRNMVRRRRREGEEMVFERVMGLGESACQGVELKEEKDEMVEADEMEEVEATLSITTAVI
jgi:hypothetical protein